MSSAEEIEQLATPDVIPSLWRYLWKEHPWVYVIVPASTAIWIVSFGWRLSWTELILSSALYGVISWFAGRAVGLWQASAAKARRAHEWVEHLSTGDKPFPHDIAWIIFHLVDDDRSNVAAAIALEFIEKRDESA